MTPEESRNGLRFAVELRLFAKENAPDVYCESKIHQMVRHLETYYGYSTRMKKAAILQYLKKGEFGDCASVAELVEHFHWNKPQVCEVVAEMVAEGQLESYKVQTSSAGGPRATRYRLP